MSYKIFSETKVVNVFSLWYSQTVDNDEGTPPGGLFSEYLLHPSIYITTFIFTLLILLVLFSYICCYRLVWRLRFSWRCSGLVVTKLFVTLTRPEQITKRFFTVEHCSSAASACSVKKCCCSNCCGIHTYSCMDLHELWICHNWSGNMFSMQWCTLLSNKI